MSLLEQTESIRFVVNSDSAVEQALQYIHQYQQGQCNVCEIITTEVDSLYYQ